MASRSGATWLSPHPFTTGVDEDPLHPREVDHQAAIAERAARDVVTHRPDRHEQIMLAGEANRRHHVGRVGTAGAMAAGRLSIIPFQIDRAAS